MVQDEATGVAEMERGRLVGKQMLIIHANISRIIVNKSDRAAKVSQTEMTGLPPQWVPSWV